MKLHAAGMIEPYTAAWASVPRGPLGSMRPAMQGIIITGVDGDWFQVFVGVVLVIAVIFNNFIRQKAAQR